MENSSKKPGRFAVRPLMRPVCWIKGHRMIAIMDGHWGQMDQCSRCGMALVYTDAGVWEVEKDYGR